MLFRSYLLKKYEKPTVETAEVEKLLEGFRQSIGGRETVLEAGFSYADILIATALQMIKPVTRKYWSIGPATREAWTLVDYEQSAADLLEWRDRLFATYRLSTLTDVKTTTPLRTSE